MFKISQHICNELKDSSVEIKKLELNERQKILDTILKKYIDSKKKYTFLWEKFNNYESLNDNKAWNYIKNFVRDDACIMFFNQEEENEMFLIKSGNDLNYILSETYGFEFYITDKECSYVICFNHHDILYGCGTAVKWIKSLKRNESTNSFM